MTTLDPTAARQFAVETVERLRAAGHEALWAGGCVRDALLNAQPKDYDVATAAEPDRVREVFGRRRTLAIGASFGVITVVGTKASGNIEVATFRRDATYSDGRHPDSVTYSTAEEDAKRRDFTINGLFYDPLADEVIDYVGGKQDLERKVIRAIGDPNERFNEDKLRILRAIRFAAVLGFSLDSATLAAIKQHARELTVVSAERIATELRKMLAHANRRQAVELLVESDLLGVVIHESRPLLTGGENEPWQQTLASLASLDVASFPIAMALLLRSMPNAMKSGETLAQTIGTRLKLSNDETTAIEWLLKNETRLSEAPTLPWPEVQRMYIESNAKYAPAYLRALTSVDPEIGPAAEFCADKLALPAEELNPPPLVTGGDLKRIGLAPGPRFKEILTTIRDLQLAGEIDSTEAAIDRVRDLLQ